MAYNNGFPVNYPQYFPQYQQQMPTPQPNSFQNGNTQNNGIIWVQGEAGAKSYLVSPNTTVQLWDSENQVIYLKSADGSGMPSMKVLDYTIRTDEKPSPVVVAPSMDNYVTREELSELEERIRRRLDKITIKDPKKGAKDE